MAQEPQLSMDYIYLGRKEGLGTELTRSISTLEELNAEALEKRDPKRKKRLAR